MPTAPWCGASPSSATSPPRHGPPESAIARCSTTPGRPPQGSRAAELPEHNSPPAASVQVMRGSLRVTGQDPVVLQAGAPEALIHSRHAVEALEDTVFLPTTVT